MTDSIFRFCKSVLAMAGSMGRLVPLAGPLRPTTAPARWQAARISMALICFASTIHLR